MSLSRTIWANSKAESIIHPVFPAVYRGPDRDRGAPVSGGYAREPLLIGVIGEYRIDVAAPSGAEVIQQLFGRGASRAGDGEERVEKRRFVLAGGAAASPPMQPFPGNLQHFERDVPQRSRPQRRGEPEPGNVAAHRLAFLASPVGDEIAGGIECRRIVEETDPQSR